MVRVLAVALVLAHQTAGADVILAVWVVAVNILLEVKNYVNY